MMHLGLTPPEIADTINCSLDMAKKINRDPGKEAAIQRLQRIGACMTQIHKGDFDQLLGLSIEVMYEVLGSDKATHDQKLRAALAIFDRHPDGEFVKTAKNINKDEVSDGLDAQTIRELKRIASRTNAKVIDVEVSSSSTSSAPDDASSQQPGPQPATSPQHEAPATPLLEAHT